MAEKFGKITLFKLAFGKKVWQINRSVKTKLDSFSLANHGQFATNFPIIWYVENDHAAFLTYFETKLKLRVAI